MILTLNQREFQFIQSYTNEMYQAANLRDGPQGAVVSAVRFKFLKYGEIDLLDTERRFLMFALQDTFVTSHSAIVKSQMGLSMQYLRPDVKPKTTSAISDPGSTTYSSAMSGTYTEEWDIIQECLRKLGQVPPAPYDKLVSGPDGYVDAISTPTGIDIRSGQLYNHM